MESEKFNLWEENWIRVRTPEGQLQEVSLEEVLLHAERYAALAGELPTQDFAMLRLLLAVLHTALFRNPLEDGDAQEAWGNLWVQGHFPEKDILTYERQWRNRFNLFDSEKPFLQVLEMGDANEKSVKKLNGEISESDNQKRLFNIRTGKTKNSLRFSEAARWLVHYIAYDDRSLKKPSPKLSFLGQLCGIYATGDTLFETLMLNLILLKNGYEAWKECNFPIWEKDETSKPPLNDSELLKITLPENPAALYTVLYRYVKLIPCDGKVEAYYARAGEWFEPFDAFSEHMTLWELDKKSGKQRLLNYQNKKQLWREFSSIAVETAAEKHQCGLVQWLGNLDEAIKPSYKITFTVVMADYVSEQKSAIDDVYYDELNLHLGLVTNLGKNWRTDINREIARCEKIAMYVKFLSSDLLKASGILDSNQATKKRYDKTISEDGERFFQKIDTAFRIWLISLDPLQYEIQHDEKIREWRTISKKAALQLGKDIIEKNGISAFSGRVIKEGKDQIDIHYSAPEAYNRFIYNINKLDSGEGI